MNTESPRRPIRSFVKREGRITKKQHVALTTLSERYCLDSSAPLDAEACFANPAPLVLEIGFGMGESFIEMVRARPEENFLGIEVHRPGIGHVLAELSEHQVTNTRLIEGDAVTWLTTCCPNDALSEVLILFPDPWHKKRHHKRRLINDAFVALLAERCRPGALLHLATDWMPYAEEMQRVLAASPHFTSHDVHAQGSASLTGVRSETKFERRGRRLGHDVVDVFYLCSK